MAQYETRSWIGWHHHMTLVGLAHLFVTLTRRRLKKSAGAVAGSDGTVVGGGVGGAAVAVGVCDRVGEVPRPTEPGGQVVPRQDLEGETQEGQIPAAVEVALEQGTVLRRELFHDTHLYRILCCVNL
jgi:hypothetical protein